MISLIKLGFCYNQMFLNNTIIEHIFYYTPDPKLKHFCSLLFNQVFMLAGINIQSKLQLIAILYMLCFVSTSFEFVLKYSNQFFFIETEFS